LELFLKIQGSSYKYVGVRVDFGKDDGPKCKVLENGIFKELFC
jgi:hypothetical protein